MTGNPLQLKQHFLNKAVQILCGILNLILSLYFEHSLDLITRLSLEWRYYFSKVFTYFYLTGRTAERNMQKERESILQMPATVRAGPGRSQESRRLSWAVCSRSLAFFEPFQHGENKQVKTFQTCQINIILNLFIIFFILDIIGDGKLFFLQVV